MWKSPLNHLASGFMLLFVVVVVVVIVVVATANLTTLNLAPTTYYYLARMNILNHLYKKVLYTEN